MLYFNSIKVQLKRGESEYLAVVNSFQFHKGTIKTIIRSSMSFGEPYFNSIKVQLKHAVAVADTQNSLFQFHKGTIKTHLII